MNINVKLLNKIQAYKIQKHIKKTMYHDHQGLSQECRIDSTYEKCVNEIHSINRKGTENALDVIQHSLIIKKKNQANKEQRQFSQPDKSIYIKHTWGTWVSQSVEHLTFTHSGHELMIS